MPDLTGMLVVSAQAELTKVGIKTVTPKFVDVPVAPVSAGNNAPMPPVRPGAVIAQQPPAGALVMQRDLVKLTVAK
jgi:beta-lactam-binding protein with PASTA domain